MNRHVYPVYVLLVTLMSLGLNSSAAAQADRSAAEHRIDLSALPRAGGVELDQGEPSGPALRVVLPNVPQPKGVQVLSLTPVPAETPLYALVGEIRYENVRQPGYLELISHFPGGGWYFSRSLAAAGPLRALQGTSGWYTFVLPFDARQAPSKPERLDFNVVLPEGGTVYLRNLSVRSFANEADFGAALRTGASGISWSNPGALGGLLGGLGGILGAVVGLLAYLRRGKVIVQTILGVFVIGGIACLIVAAWSASRSEPFMSYYVYLLLGIILTCVGGFNYRPTMRHYEADELRRMEALDRRPG